MSLFVVVVGLAILVAAPVFAGTNEWTFATGSSPGGTTCHTDGVPSIDEAVACHGSDNSRHHCGAAFANTMNLSAAPKELQTRQVDDVAVPFDCVAGTFNTPMNWVFTDSCAAVGMEFNDTYGGCAEICTPPEELNPVTGMCELPDVTQRSCPVGSLSKGNPCDVLFGNKSQREVDYAPGTGALAFVRTYNSLRYHSAKQGAYGKPLGESWFGSYLQFISAPSGLSSTVVRAVRPNGDVIGFTATIPGSTSTLYQAEGELKDRLVVATNGSGGFIGWVYVTSNDDQELYDTNGRLVTIQSRAGVVQLLTYGANSRVATVTDDFGHQLSFQWDAASPPRLTGVTLPGAGSGQIAFTYGASNNLTLVTYPDTRTREYLYELTGTGQENLLTGIEDESGVRYVTWGYGTGNVVTSSVHSGGVDSYSITYNTDGTRVVVDPLGTSFTYSSQVIAGQRRYTGSNLLCQGCGEYASATFDTFGNFESKVDFGGIETRFAHDTARTLETSRTEAFGTPRARTISTTWHPTYRLPDVVTEPGRTTDYDYDASGNLLELEVTDTATSEVRRTTWTYDGYGRVLTADGPRTDVTDVSTFVYYTCGTGNQCGQVQSITNALSQVTNYDSYNAHGQPLQITDPNGVIATLAYDFRQRLTSRTVAGEQTQLEYWPTGLLKKVTLPDGSFLLYTYDNAHRLTRIDDAAGNYVVYTLDGMGNRTAENVYDPTNFLHRTRSSVFNSLNQLWKDLTAAGTAAQTTEFGYDTRGNQTAINAPLGRNTGNAYDELGRLMEMTDPATGITQLGYDARDNLTSVTDPRSKVTSYTYNGFDDLKTQTSPDSGLTTNTYDSGGNLETSTDARNAITTYGYDALNRVTSAAYKIGTTTDQTIAFTYDAGTFGKGRRTGASDANHSLSWVYDALGRVTSKTQTVGTVAKTVGYGYTNGNLTTLTTPSGQTVVYGYNTNGQVTSITVNSTTLLSGVTYEPFGPIKGWTWGNGAAMWDPLESTCRHASLSIL